jgi:hypothetical protein
VTPERIRSPREFAHEVAAHLATLDAAGARPSDDELVALVDVTFFASLHEEEARRAPFNLAWQPAPDGCAAVIAMTPVVATPNSLAKLAPATRQEATSIAIRRDGDELVAWALLERNTLTVQPLTLRVLGPGVLRIDLHGVPRALYARGRAVLLDARRDPSPARWLTRRFAAWRAAADPAIGIDPRAAIITRIAARALEHGHGGMLLVVPAGCEPRGVRVHYPVSDGADLLSERYRQVTRDIPPADRLERLLGSRPRHGGHVQVRDHDQIAFAEAVEGVARLTAIDNAVLVDTELRLRGFGVQVIDAGDPAMTFRHADPYSDEVHTDDLSTYKGTRHPAGVIFCMAQEREAAAIIASQDRRLSLAGRTDAGGVEVLGSYEGGFGWR